MCMVSMLMASDTTKEIHAHFPRRGVFPPRPLKFSHEVREELRPIGIDAQAGGRPGLQVRDELVEGPAQAHVELRHLQFVEWKWNVRIGIPGKPVLWRPVRL